MESEKTWRIRKKESEIFKLYNEKKLQKEKTAL